MAIPSPHNAQTIASEFAPSTRNVVNGSTDITLYNLSAMSGAVGLPHNANMFVGKARATVSGNLTTSVSSPTVTLEGNYTAGGVETEIEAQYQSAVDGNDNELAIPSEDESDWTTFVSTTVSSGTSISLSGTVPNGRYFFRLKVFNGFISHVADHLHIQPSNLTERRDVNYSPPKWPTPTIISCSNPSGGNSMFAEWFYGENPSTFQAQLRINGGSAFTGTIKAGTAVNWGSVNNNKEGEFEAFVFPNPGDFFEIRVRAAASGGVSASNYSGWCGVTV